MQRPFQLQRGFPSSGRDADFTRLIYGAIHSSRLLWRHVRERSGDELWRLGRLALAREARCDAEAGETDLSSCGVHQNVGGFDVLVDHPTSV
jgi:hypothetical protein